MADNIEIPAIQGTIYNYRYIDHGAQFRVYAILTADGKETGRVIKVPLSFDESRAVLSPHLKNIGKTEAEIDRRIHTLLTHKQQLPELLQGMYASDKQLMYLLGNLKLIPVLARPEKAEPEYFMPLYFTQDHVQTMADFMHPFRFAHNPPYSIKLQDIKRAKQLMYAITKLHYRLWEYGIFELSFKIENIGIVAQNGDIKAILVDAAEHTSDPELARQAIEKQQWRKCLLPEKTDHLFMPTILHKVYADICNRAFTVEEFNKHWRKRSNVIEQRAERWLRFKQLITVSNKKELAIWIERQTLHNDLHRGLPQDRVDTMHIPHADLRLLLDSSTVGDLPLSHMEQQEKAERTLHENDYKSMLEVYRHTFPIIS